MTLREWLTVDLKRLFRGRGLILATLLLPLLGLMVFGSVAAPMLAIEKDLRVSYAICNMDDSETVRQFVRLMTNSESLRELGTVYPVADEETGYRLLQEGRVGVLVFIPEGFYQKMSAGEDPVVQLVSYPAHSFEQTMVRLTLDGSLRAVGQSQNILDAVGAVLREAGADETAASAMLEAELTSGIERYLQRRASLGQGGTISPVGELFPLEYYLSALFSLFGALAMLPSLHLTASDISGGVLRRGLLTDRRTAVRYCGARLLSGAALILLTLLLLLPASGVIQSVEILAKAKDAAVYPYMAAALLLTALGFSSLSLLIAGLIGKPRAALWCGFLGVLLMAWLSGALVAEGKLPATAAELGHWMPMKPAMNLIANVLFGLDRARYAHNMLRLTLLTALFSVGGSALVCRRGGAA